MTWAGRRSALALVALIAGCTFGPTETSAFEFAGEWSYEGTQNVPGPASITGPMEWASAGGTGLFEGGAVWTEVVPGGGVRMLTGLVAGAVVSDTIVEFTAAVSGVTRWHQGIVRGDSTWGVWTDLSGPTATGTYVARRDTP
jgi:hypothetical protein